MHLYGNGILIDCLPSKTKWWVSFRVFYFVSSLVGNVPVQLTA